MSHIINKAPNSRSNVTSYQADFFAVLVRELLAVYERNPAIELKYWFELPEYDRFIKGAYVCGFVCENFNLMKEFEFYQNQSDTYLKTAGWNKFRHYVHRILRGEKWSDGFSSPILDAARSGRLEIVADRLEHDRSLREPAPIDVNIFDDELIEMADQLKKEEK